MQVQAQKRVSGVWSVAVRNFVLEEKQKNAETVKMADRKNY